MKHVVGMLFVVAAFGLLFGCSGMPYKIVRADKVTTKDEVTTSPEQDLLTKLLTNGKKQDGYFSRVVASMLVNGSIDKQTHKCELIANQFEYCKETWYITDVGKNQHMVFIENGRITGVDEYKDPNAAALPEPAGGWQH